MMYFLTAHYHVLVVQITLLNSRNCIMYIPDYLFTLIGEFLLIKLLNGNK
jgi:hypothetical protein